MDRKTAMYPGEWQPSREEGMTLWLSVNVHCRDHNDRTQTGQMIHADRIGPCSCATSSLPASGFPTIFPPFSSLAVCISLPLRSLLAPIPQISLSYARHHPRV